MAYQKALLKLEIKDIVLVKPTKSTPSCLLSLSTIDNKAYNDEICQTIHVYRSSIHNSPNNSFNPSHLIKQALSKSLFYYYPLAGRLVKHADDGKLRVKCNPNEENYGVPVLEANAKCTLSSLHYLDNTDTDIAKHLMLDLPSPHDKTYPLVLMVTKFLCGGFTIGMGVSHALCDGFGGSQFFKSIVELASGRIEPSVKPVWERERLVGSITKQSFQSLIDKDLAAFSPFLQPKTIIKQYCFKIESDVIKRLKMSLMKESESHSNITTFESLAAYVWRSKARALKLSPNGKTVLIMEVGMRGKNLKDYEYTLPEGYYGNAIVDADLVLNVNELNEKPLSEIVKLIKETKNVASTIDYVRKSIDTMETIRQEEEEEEEDLNIDDAIMYVTDWKHLGFMESVDFEGYELSLLKSGDAPGLDTCIFMSQNKIDDPILGEGVRIFISLPVAAMPKFKEEIDALRFL
ncbi:spermidine coumaroyl-CoA acyltransferase-like [Trifolium pratense]|uniref:spermidine coumaroyl-CoA acyltransferase-like n=1 Tax=Trifolium pratense TaxID=57577 RepID=UPI001E693E90|nr:spermidine coumaroyl-CoA acyltransferase-like [Trifolium pratense]